MKTRVLVSAAAGVGLAAIALGGAFSSPAEAEGFSKFMADGNCPRLVDLYRLVDGQLGPAAKNVDIFGTAIKGY